MQREAELYAEEDRRKREAIEVKNTADTMAYQAEKTLRDNADKIPSHLKTEVEEKVKAVREAMESNDVARMRSAMDALSASLQKIGEAVYGAAGAGSASSGPSGSGPAEEGTVEGEFREV